jgi:hypothetical protein
MDLLSFSAVLCPCDRSQLSSDTSRQDACFLTTVEPEHRPASLHLVMQRINVGATNILHVCHHSQFVAGSIHASIFTRPQHLRQFHASRTAAGSASNDAVSITVSKLDLSEDAVELVNTTSAISSGILSTSADLFLSLPQLFGGAPYALSIVLMTIALRSSITMPLTVWQRRRVRRVQEKVVPAAKKWMAVARYNLRTEFRRAGKGYEEYVAELNKQVSLVSDRS